MAPTGREDCPVDFILSYMDFARDKFPEGVEKFLFPTLSPKNIPLGKTMSYQSALKQLRKATTELNIPLEDARRFGLHSCRGGEQQLLLQTPGCLYRLSRKPAGGLRSPPPEVILNPARRSGA